MAQTADAGLARSLLNAALAFGKTKPDIDESQMLLLMSQAAVTVESETVFTTASLNAVAAQGWRWKAALASDGYDDLGRIKRLVGLAERWRAYAADYASGSLDVLGGIVPAPPRRVSGSIGMVTELATEYPYE